MAHFLFLTTNNFASNPRLLKEVKLALESGHRVTAFTFILSNWSDVKSKILIDQLKRDLPNKSKQLTEIKLEAIPKNKLKWTALAIFEKISRKLSVIFRSNLTLNSYANNRRSFQLINKAIHCTDHPDVICAHNLGSLYPAYRLSELWNKPFVFDVEDYHPGELFLGDQSNEKGRRELLMTKILPNARGLTFASPLIGEHTLDLIGEHERHLTILNCFEESEFKLMAESQNLTTEVDCLNLIWFSQKISFGRGLEQLFQALIKLNLKNNGYFFNLTLIGERDPHFQKKNLLPFLDRINKESISVKIYGPMAQKDLHRTLIKYDVGLALELTNTDLNRQICLSNKIITYFQAGLYIFATNTQAQYKFIESNPENGILTGQSAEELYDNLVQIYEDRFNIKRDKASRYQKGKQISWELEQIKLKELWNNIV